MNDISYNSQYMDIDNDFEPASSSSNCKKLSLIDTPDKQNKNNADEDVETIEEEHETPLWSIDDDTLFQPCGLINHSTSNDKSVFVTWNEDYLLNFRFKKSKRNKCIQMTKVRIPLPSDGGLVREVHILEFNTLVLMSTGRVYYFSSVKSLHAISWLIDVRCFAHSKSGFSIIRYVSEGQRLLLEVYADVASIGKCESTLLSTYDITYDEQNIFNCAWTAEYYTLSAYVIESTADVSYLQKLLCVEEGMLQIGKELFIYSISGHVFLLIPTGTQKQTDYHIQLLCVYASSVTCIKLLPHRNLCLVFLDSGSIDLWYISNLTKLRQRKMHHTGTEFWDFDGVSSNGDFYYTDGAQLGRLAFVYDDCIDDCRVNEDIKYIEGMLACTWVPHLQQLICISSNNIFYRITFDKKPVAEEVMAPKPAATQHKLSELTLADIKRLHSNAKIVAEYADLPAQLHAKIEHEFQQQQLIAVDEKSELFSKMIHVELTYYQHLPASIEKMQRSTVILTVGAEQNWHYSSSIFAVLHLELKGKNEIFNCAQWQLFIQYDKHMQVLRIPKKWLLNNNCIVVVPLMCSAGNKKCLPEFSLAYCSFIKVATAIRAIMIPLEVKEHKNTYTALFSHSTKRVNICDKPNVCTIVENFKQSQGCASIPEPTFKQVQQIFKLPQNISFKNVLDIFDAPLIIAEDDDELAIYFVNSKIKFKYICEQQSLLLTSKDATALYYFKLHLLLNLKTDLTQAECHEDLKQLVMKYQCEAERCYGLQIRTMDDVPMNTDAHLLNLQNLYKKLRKELF